MAKKYTYTRTISTVHGTESFTASEFDSFDEAQRAVEKGIHDRKLQIASEPRGLGVTGADLPDPSPFTPSGSLNAPIGHNENDATGATTAHLQAPTSRK